MHIFETFFVDLMQRTRKKFALNLLLYSRYFIPFALYISSFFKTEFYIVIPRKSISNAFYKLKCFCKFLLNFFYSIQRY